MSVGTCKDEATLLTMSLRTGVSASSGIGIGVAFRGLTISGHSSGIGGASDRLSRTSWKSSGLRSASFHAITPS